MTTLALQPARADALRIHPTRSLLMLYAFLAPLGNLARFSAAEASYGITTVVLVIVVVINLLPSLKILRRNRLLFSLALLTAWMGVASLVSPNVIGALSQLINVALYVLFACAAYRLNWTSGTLYRLVLCFVIGGFISSTVTIVDFFHIVDIPRVNEGSSRYTATGLGAVLQASGPFFRRSAMAAYFAILIPIAVQAFRYVGPARLIERALYIATTATASIALLLTHNRAGLLGAVIAIAFMSVLMARSPGKMLRLFAGGAVAVAVLAWVLTTYFPEQLRVYEVLLKFTTLRPEESYLDPESDRIRLILFEHVVRSLGENPVGNGFTLVTGQPRHPDADAHNIVTQIIWSAGVLGIGWMLYFSATMINRLRRNFSKESLRDPTLCYTVVIASGLLGWLLCGMMHQIIGIGMAWLWLGILIKLTTALPPSAQAPAWSSSRR